MLEGLRGEYSIAQLCRREGIAQGLYYTWSKDFIGLSWCGRGDLNPHEVTLDRF